MKPCYISFGAGTQSSALLLLSEQGVIKGIKGAIFADTGSEPQRVYDWLDFIKTKIKKTPIHIIKSDRYPSMNMLLKTLIIQSPYMGM